MEGSDQKKISAWGVLILTNPGHPVIFSDDDWDVQSPPKPILRRRARTPRENMYLPNGLQLEKEYRTDLNSLDHPRSFFFSIPHGQLARGEKSPSPKGRHKPNTCFFLPSTVGYPHSRCFFHVMSWSNSL